MHVGLGKSFLYSEIGEGNSLNIFSFPLPSTKEGISLIKVQRKLEREVTKVLVRL